MLVLMIYKCYDNGSKKNNHSQLKQIWFCYEINMALECFKK